MYDLGCGDGRICLAAAKLGASAVGVEIEPDLARSFSRQIEAQGLGELVRCVCGDLRELDPAELERATVLVVYLLPEALPGCRSGCSSACSAGRGWSATPGGWSG